MYKTILLLSLVLTTIASCSLKKISNTLSSNRVYENFYIGDNGNQWYIYPLKFSNKTTHFLVDFTIKDNAKDTVTVKYSIITKKQLSKPKSIMFNLANNEKYNLDLGKKIFVETEGDILHLRYVSTMTYPDFLNFFNSINSITIDGLDEPVVPTKATKKKIDAVNRQVIKIIENY